MKQRNGTTWAEGTYNTFTGETDPNLFGAIHTFNGQTRTHYSGDCGSIHGSAEGFYPPFGARSKGLAQGEAMPNQLDIYTNEACTALSFIKTPGLVDHLGLKGVKYVLDESTFANKTVFDKNACYENNLPSGLQNVTLCKAKNGIGAPIFLSFPHFYAADPFYLAQFTEDSDLAPNQDLHQPHMVLETQMSVPIELNFRLQLNVKVDPYAEIE